MVAAQLKTVTDTNCRQSHCGRHAIERVVAVGGSSASPMLEAFVKQHYPNAIWDADSRDDPLSEWEGKLAAQGAAIVGALHTNARRGVKRRLQ